MGILDKAKSLAQKEKDAIQVILDYERKEREDKEKLVNAVRQRVVILLSDDLDGKDGFTVRIHLTGVQSIASVSHNGTRIGFINVVGETYEYAGSDECPNETAWHVKVSYATYGTTPSLYVGINHEGAIEEGIEEFSEQLACHLKGYYQ